MLKKKLYSRPYHVGVLLILLLTIAWLLDLKMIGSIKEECLSSPESAKWKVNEKGNFWNFGHPWILFESKRDDHLEWYKNIGKLQYPDQDELRIIPERAKELGSMFKIEWKKFKGENSIIYFGSSQDFDRDSIDQDRKIFTFVVVVNF